MQYVRKAKKCVRNRWFCNTPMEMQNNFANNHRQQQQCISVVSLCTHFCDFLYKTIRVGFK